MTKVKSNGPDADQFPSIFTDFLGTEFFDNDFFRAPDSSWMPSANVVENPGSFVIELAIPGFEKEEINVQAEGKTLMIQAHREEETSEEKKKYTRREFRTSSFARSFNLPKMVNVEKIDAKYDNGILRVTLPKREGANGESPRKIEIS